LPVVHSYSPFNNDAFWRVSADTKTCGSPLYLSPTGGLCLPAGKHAGILTLFQTIVNKKMNKKHFFLVILSRVEGPIKTKAGFAGLKWIYTND